MKNPKEIEQYTESKKFSNKSLISTFITEIHNEINTNWTRFFCDRDDFNLIQYKILHAS